MKRAYLVWAAVLVPVWIVLMLCCHWEPVVRDGWGHVQWHKNFDTTLGNVWMFGHDSYLHNNPRFGQVLTLLVFTPGPYHVIVTPLVELGLVWLLTAFALGRKPSFASTDDALVCATVLGLVAMAAPNIGQLLFYRPYTGNYLFGFAISLAFLLPYRFHVETPRARGWWWIPIMLAGGFITGMCNEHTGPAVALLAFVATVVAWRRGELRAHAWLIAGIIGVLVGGLVLFYAPGQDIRYNGLGQGSLLGRIGDRSLAANVKVVAALPGYLWPSAAWILLGTVAWLARRFAQPRPEPMSRARLWSALAAIAAAFLVAFTLLVSPKQGPRLYFASACLVISAIASLAVPQLVQRWSRIAAWALAGVAIAYFSITCLRVYGEVGPEFAKRFDAIETTATQEEWTLRMLPPHLVVTVTPYTRPKSRWFIGEDFGVDQLRFNLAFSRHLQGIVLDSSAEVNTEPTGGL